MPSLLTALTPVAASPIAAIGAEETGGFAAVIATFDTIFPIDATLPAHAAAPVPGMPLPPGRPMLAAEPVPDPLLEAEPVLPGDATAPEPVAAGMIACEMPIPRRWALRGASPIALTRSAPARPDFKDAPVDAKMVPHAAPVVGSTPIAPPRRAALISEAPVIERDEQTNPEAAIVVPPDAPAPAVVAPPPVSLSFAQWRMPDPVDPTHAEQEHAVPLAEVAAPIVSTSEVLARVATVEQPQLPVMAESPATVAPLAAVQGISPTLFAPTPVKAAEPATARVQAQAPLVAPALATTTTTAPPTFAIPAEVARHIAQFFQSSTVDEPAEPPAFADATPVSLTSTFTAPPAQLAASPVQSVVQAQPSFIDTVRAEWMQAMIEQIGDIAQVDGKREAQIRLLPDSLGAIEVKIEQRQDRMHVTLTSDNAQTRQMLADAAPRLHELAEARGLRFAQAGIGGGDAQDRRPAPEQPQTPLRPRSALETASDDESTGDLIA